MNWDWQSALTWVAVAGAVGYLARIWWPRRPAQGACATSGGCPGCSQAAQARTAEDGVSRGHSTSHSLPNSR
jgi:hypothetical protein